MQAPPVIKREFFTHGGNSYYVAVTYSNGHIEAKAYHENGNPVNRTKSAVDVGVAMDAATVAGLDAVAIIIAEARKSVENP